MRPQREIASPAPAVRGGMSLLEVTIAMLVFIIVMTAVMEFMLATRRLNSLGEAEDDLNTAGTRVLQKIAEDLSQSGWHFPSGDPLSIGSFVTDRTERYFPFVEQQDFDAAAGLNEGLGSQFPHTHRTFDLVALPIAAPTGVLPGMPGDTATNFHAHFSDMNPLTRKTAKDYLDSYYARSQELIFLREIARKWESDPTQVQPPEEKFGLVSEWKVPDDHDHLGIAYPGGWTEKLDALNNITGYQRRTKAPSWTSPGPPPGFAKVGGTIVPELYGIPLHGGRMQMDEGVLSITPVWETIAAPDYTDPASDELREYMYAVVPSGVGLGRLVRAHLEPDVTGIPYGSLVGQYISKSGTAGMVVDEIFSDDVVRVVFDTARTDSDLDIDEVRVRLYLARRQASDPNLIVHRTVECIVQMRAKCSPADRKADRIMVGNSPPVFNY